MFLACIKIEVQVYPCMHYIYINKTLQNHHIFSLFFSQKPLLGFKVLIIFVCVYVSLLNYIIQVI